MKVYFHLDFVLRPEAHHYFASRLAAKYERRVSDTRPFDAFFLLLDSFWITPFVRKIRSKVAKDPMAQSEGEEYHKARSLANANLHVSIQCNNQS